MNYKPHSLREKDACTHIGLGRTKFRTLVNEGRLPAPYWLDGCKLWITNQLEQSADALMGAANDNTATLAHDSWSDVIPPQSIHEEEDQ
jgi:hypothetical protein